MMFGSIIYFITVLLIYVTYQPAEGSGRQPLTTALTFLAITALFGFFTKTLFQRLERQVRAGSGDVNETYFEGLITRQSILAVILFAVHVYGLELPAYTRRVEIFKAFPTLEAVLFLSVFIGHLIIIWSCAYPVYRLSRHDTGNQWIYIKSNLSFSVPVLLPWFILSSLSDIIFLLPFETPGRWLQSPIGQAVFFIFFLMIVAFFGPIMIQRFWGCRPLEPGPARARIEAFCRHTGVRYAEILNWPLFGGRMLTAGVMGLVGRFRYILVTPALLQFLSFEELDAVMAHEIGHVKKRHLIFYLFFFISLMPTIVLTHSLIGQLMFAAIIYFKPLYTFVGGEGIRWISQNPTFQAGIFILLVYLYFRYVFGFFMRNFERQADLHIFAYFQTAVPLIASLRKIAIVSRQSPDTPNWHHFSIRERIDYLMECERDRKWIHRHNVKLRNSILLYLAGMFLVAGAYYQLSFGPSGQRLSAHLLETMLQREITNDPGNPVLYRELGDYYYILVKNYKRAVDTYERAIEIDPHAPEALNNLAWLYATCEDPVYRNARRALNLALRAAAIKPAAHILDTLAESYYLNGDYEKALQTGQKAAASADPRERSHYDAQLEKFRQAVQKQKAEQDRAI